jgi:hypothetical protein
LGKGERRVIFAKEKEGDRKKRRGNEQEREGESERSEVLDGKLKISQLCAKWRAATPLFPFSDF